MKAVIFDLFETLITEWTHRKFTVQNTTDYLNADYSKYKEVWEEMHNEMYTGELATAEAIKLCCTKQNIIPTDEQIDYVIQQRIETKKTCFNDIDNSIEIMLRTLKEKGLLIGLISNCSSDEVKALKDSRLYCYFDRVILSFEVGLSKPDIRIYEKMCEELNQKAEDCVFVGDGGSNELYGAEKAGMKPMYAAWFRNKHDSQKKEMPYTTLNTPLDIMNYQ